MIVGGCLMFCTSALAQTDYVTIGIEPHSYLPHYGYEEGHFVGFAREVLDQFVEDHGMQAQYQPMPIRHLMVSLIDQKIDLKYPDNELWWDHLKKQAKVIYSDPVTGYIDGVSVPPSQLNQKISSFSLLSGFVANGYLDQIEAGEIRVKARNGMVPVIDLALSGQVNGVYSNIEVVDFFLKSRMNRPGALVYDPSKPQTRSHYHLSSVKRPELIKLFNTWLKLNSGKIFAIKKRYGLKY